jgi:hypothetical protein
VPARQSSQSKPCPSPRMGNLSAETEIFRQSQRAHQGMGTDKAFRSPVDRLPTAERVDWYAACSLSLNGGPRNDNGRKEPRSWKRGVIRTVSPLDEGAIG